MNIKSKKEKGLSDAELVTKYESGKFDLKKALKPMLKTHVNSSNLRDIKNI